MREDFKKKLEDYSNGLLSKEENEEVEKELDKMELYQSYLDSLMGSEEEPEKEYSLEKKLVKKGKWKARLQNAWTALSLLLLFLIVGWITSAIFYSWGNPSRQDTYSDVIKAAVETTQPNITIGSTSMNSGVFTMNYEGELRKMIGREKETVEQFETKFLFGFFNVDLPDSLSDRPIFFYSENVVNYKITDGFDQLEKLPEGTVSELYITFTDYMSTDDFLKKMEDKEMMPVWMAADTGRENERESNPIGPAEPFGFPYMGYGFRSDFKTVSREQKKGGYSAETAETESIESYGDGEKREAEFLKALHLIEEYRGRTEHLHWQTKEELKAKIDYIEENGVRLYGAVVTGPSKELLKLKEEEWVGSAKLGEKRLWNW
ncbi:anti-sigma factor [Bacillus infantis]|uniref:anti-sigma factor n=1 Tax=Bacillus infantis TaxID=324767 RepID=UPI0021553BB9|nr:anti-sigma factor [Bacillus infantis]MCR6609508.1 anti-sigma factor [Bacillus infantis]